MSAPEVKLEMTTDAREIAYDVTRRVNSKGGYLGLLLRYGLDRSGLDPRDRSLVTDLAYGVQRHRNRLDHIIAAFSLRPRHELDPEVLDILRLGIYQLSETGTPPHAAVNETVGVAKRRLGAGAASFVNAVMRRACAGLDDLSWPPREELSRYLETVYSHPRWLVDYLRRLLGDEAAEALCAADNTIPDLSLRVNTDRVDVPSLMEEILQDGRASRSPHLEEALVRVGMPHGHLVSILERGLCVVQDESSMLASHAVHPAPGSTVVDACAAPGGKATHLAQLGGADCRVIAMDRNARRLRALHGTIERLGITNIEVREGDATRLHDYVPGEVDAVLVDAPCSGLGTLQRNPELRWRRLPEDLARLSRVQLSLLEGCSESLRSGGALVYSVCTYSAEETLRVIEGFLEARRDYHLDDLSPHLPPSLSGEAASGGHIQLMPHLHQMEGMFIARLVRD